MKVTINTTNGQEEVEAVKAGPYFAVHPTLMQAGKEPSKYGKWALTHVPSGLKVADFQFKSKAVACGQEFCQIAGDVWAQVHAGFAREQFDAATYRALIDCLNRYR